MTGIHDAILTHVRAGLQKALIDDLADDDPTKVGVVSIGPIQGDPTPDDARISVMLFENDPDAIIGGAVSSLAGDWSDEVDEIEIGSAITHVRRFSVKARCLLVNTAENSDAARSIASTVRERIETTLLHMSFTGVMNDSGYVSRDVLAEDFAGEMLQAGGPEAYDYQIKVRFSLLTTTRTGVSI